MGKRRKQNAVIQAIGSNIRQIRREQGLSQEQLANMVSIDRPYLSLIENGKTNVTVDILAKIADGFDLPIVALFRGLESTTPYKLQHSRSYAVVKLPKK